MKQGTFLKKILIVAVVALLVCAGAGYAQEYYQGRGQIEIDSDFMGFSAAHVMIVISDGDAEIQADSELTDGGLIIDLSASAEGSDNSSRELTVWHDSSISIDGYTETGDLKTTEFLQAEGDGLVITTVKSDNYIYHQKQIIVLSND